MGTACRRITSRILLSLSCLCVLALCVVRVSAEEAVPMIMCRAELAAVRRQALSEQLGAITGWRGLHFDTDGVLRFGSVPPAGGSPAARALLTSAQTGKKLIIIEDASGRADVVFARVVEGRWKTEDAARPPVFVVQLDFTDFSRVMGDREARAAFNAGWGLMHEVDHVVNDSVDPGGLGMLGECEDAVNLMRRECGLAERADYFYTFLPGADRGTFQTRFVRLPFDGPLGNDRRRRYWLYWDAALTGDLNVAGQVSSDDSRSRLRR